MKNKNINKNVMKPSKEELRVKKEIKIWEKSIAKKYDDPGQGAYLFKCMHAAQKIYKELLDMHHTGTSMGITIDFLNKLADGMPLTPLTGEDNEWGALNIAVKFDEKDGVINKFQNTRYPSLFKEVYSDGTVKYHDNNRVMCFDPIMENYYQFGLANLVYDEMDPIKMPYWPEKEPVCLEAFTFQADQSAKENSDFDTVAIIQKYEESSEDGDIVTPINRFFREPKEGEKPTLGHWVEIDILEFAERIKDSAYKNLDLSDLGLEGLYKREKFKKKLLEESPMPNA